jgi:hypothetical protein
VIWFRKDGVTKQIIGLTKPFSGQLEFVRKRSSSRIARSVLQRRDAAMLSEKFLLLLESLIHRQGQTYPNGGPRVISTSPHVPIQLPGEGPQAR